MTYYVLLPTPLAKGCSARHRGAVERARSRRGKKAPRLVLVHPERECVGVGLGAMRGGVSFRHRAKGDGRARFFQARVICHRECLMLSCFRSNNEAVVVAKEFTYA